MYPAAEAIVGFEMRIICCERRQPLALPQQLVKQIPSIAAVDFDETGLMASLGAVSAFAPVDA